MVVLKVCVGYQTGTLFDLYSMNTSTFKKKVLDQLSGHSLRYPEIPVFLLEGSLEWKEIIG